ncbi:hypothetical protein chiPu_0009284 [Chiloscyllium punctatum]|uniref:Uncharacterized protein n=1 Tax=Chiloscyllium punctatum TaxID=137246 RepID=A0A401SKB7_CHIPU|nr:hypothetical protein [Chiloscyllium punctatum]
MSCADHPLFTKKRIAVIRNPEIQWMLRKVFLCLQNYNIFEHLFQGPVECIHTIEMGTRFVHTQIAIVSTVHCAVFYADYGGIPVFYNCEEGEPTVLSLSITSSPTMVWLQIVSNIFRLIELGLSHNNFTSIPQDHEKLQYLYMEANQIREFNVSSFSHKVNPVDYSQLRILQFDENKLTYSQIPSDRVNCLREITEIIV